MSENNHVAKQRVTNSDIMAAIAPLQEGLAAARADVAKVDKSVGELTVQIKGNGGKGVLKRLDEHDRAFVAVHKWQRRRPITCPATAKEVTRRIVLIVGAVAGGLTVISVVVSLFLRPAGYRSLEEELRRATPVLEEIEKFNRLLETLQKMVPP